MCIYCNSELGFNKLKCYFVLEFTLKNLIFTYNIDMVMSCILYKFWFVNYKFESFICRQQRRSRPLLLRLSIDDTALYDALVQPIYDEQPILPDRNRRNDSERKLRMRICASLPQAVSIAVASELTHQLPRLAVDHHDTARAGRVEVSSAI